MPIRYHFELFETIATIIADTNEIIKAASDGLIEARHEVERYIAKDPFFRLSYEPVNVPKSPLIVHDMAYAALMAGVGPMASVAGAIAAAGIRKAEEAGAKYCIIDNGGDIAYISDREVTVGLYAGISPLSGKYAFRLDPIPGIYGVCTSSATVGHSFSFGSADSVTVFAKDPVLADAFATRVCNELTVEDHSCLDCISRDIDGIFAVFGEKSLIWGKIPPIIASSDRTYLITRGGTG